jgi:predicted N-acetyltransferase YhbS
MPTRLATLDDVPELVRVINRAYEVEADMFVDKRTDDADVRERLARPNACILVVDDDASNGRVLAGAVYVETRGERGYFGPLAVDPDRQGRGLGRELVRAAERHCASAGCVFLDLDMVDLREELPRFYSALGFTMIGRTPYPDPSRTQRPVQLVHMTKPI